MKRTTRAATEQSLPDLVAQPPRAHMSFVRDGSIEALPVACWRDRDCWVIRAAMPVPSGRAMLVIDDGVYYFDLRGLRYPGLVEAPLDSGEQRFVPEKAIGWDYGSMRMSEKS
jgi:hypothetical protein